ncbi:MAG: histidine phosphatase family protein [Gammaproteobacteria bacterium]|nr:histidine phosphatase family protein [Gammaproteobacteria bacterium]
MDKRLSIIRHAKSDWSAGCRDFDRALNKRGINDAQLIGKYLSTNKQRFDKIYCSTANRAQLTLQQLNLFMKLTDNSIRYEESLYLASLTHLLAFIGNVSNDYNHIALIAHNPGLTDLCNYLTGDQLINLPTCAVYTIHFWADEWNAIGFESGTKKSLVTPKMIKDK